MTAFQVPQLVPYVITEQHVLPNGKKVTVYRCPYPTEGPVHAREWDEPVLKFMYAHFVFTWRQGTSKVDISHGTIELSFPLWKDQPIEGEWSAQSLRRFGYAWTRRHLDRFFTRGREVTDHG